MPATASSGILVGKINFSEAQPLVISAAKIIVDFIAKHPKFRSATQF
jgi:hypothetical protein